MARVRRILIATPVPGKSGWTSTDLSVLRMHTQTMMEPVEEYLRQRLSIPEEDTFEFILADVAWSSAGSAIGRRNSRFEEWYDYVANGVDIWGDPHFDVVLVPAGPSWKGANGDFCVGRATGMLLYTCITNHKPAYMLGRDEAEDGTSYHIIDRGISLDIEDEESWTHYARLCE